MTFGISAANHAWVRVSSPIGLQQIEWRFDQAPAYLDIFGHHVAVAKTTSYPAFFASVPGILISANYTQSTSAWAKAGLHLGSLVFHTISVALHAIVCVVQGIVYGIFAAIGALLGNRAPVASQIALESGKATLLSLDLLLLHLASIPYPGFMQVIF